MSAILILDLDKEIANTLSEIQAKLYVGSRRQFVESFLSITLFAYISEDTGPLELDTVNALNLLIMEYFDHDTEGDVVQRACELFIKAFKYRYEHNTEWKEVIKDLTPPPGQYSIDEMFTITLSRDLRYIHVY